MADVPLVFTDGEKLRGELPSLFSMLHILRAYYGLVGVYLI